MAKAELRAVQKKDTPGPVLMPLFTGSSTAQLLALPHVHRGTKGKQFEWNQDIKATVTTYQDTHQRGFPELCFIRYYFEGD